MGIKSDILKLPSPPYEFYESCEYDSDIASTCFNLGTEQAAELAEARENELIEEIRVTENNLADSMSTTKRLMNKCDKLLEHQAQMIAENTLLTEKVATYEQLLHRIQLNADVTMNANAVHQLIVNICNWSYAHRVGNGALSDEEQNECIKRAFDKLLEIKQ